MLDKNNIRPENQRLEGNNMRDIMSQHRINVSDTKITDNDLKYTPKSEFINNVNVLSPDDVLRMSEAEKVELLMKLQNKNEEVRKENEQFRQKNFIMLCKIRKIEKMNANDE